MEYPPLARLLTFESRFLSWSTSWRSECRMSAPRSVPLLRPFCIFVRRRRSTIGIRVGIASRMLNRGTESGFARSEPREYVPGVPKIETNNKTRSLGVHKCRIETAEAIVKNFTLRTGTCLLSQNLSSSCNADTGNAYLSRRKGCSA